MSRTLIGLLAIIIGSFSSNSHAGWLDWLIPTAYSPDEKQGLAIDYGLSGGELNSVMGGTISNETLTKFKEAAQWLTYAKLSSAVYGRNVTEGAWDRLDDEVGQYGFHASTYKNRYTGQIVIAFQGTCTGDAVVDCVSDLTTDLVGVATISSQQIQAIDYVKKIISNPDYGQNVQLTGHSLGGGLAQTAAAVLGLEVVTFNSATVNNVTHLIDILKTGVPNVTNIVMTGDTINPSSKLFGIAGRDYGKNVYLDFEIQSLNVLGEHGLTNIINSLTAMSNYYNDILQEKYANQTDSNFSGFGASLAKNSTLAIVQSGASHIGSASFGYQIPTTSAGSTPQTSNLYGANYKETTDYNATPPSSYSSAQSFSSSAWIIKTGDFHQHFDVTKNYGSITPAFNSPIYSLNNANVPYTLMEKTFTVPYNVTSANISSIMNFVTTEYPVYVGSQFNDQGLVTITSPGGKTITTLLNGTVNASSFTPVTGMPAPLDGYNPNDGAGQTGWTNANKTIPVAPGGQLAVQVKVTNVGDTLYPSAVLINKLDVK